MKSVLKQCIAGDIVLQNKGTQQTTNEVVGKTTLDSLLLDWYQPSQ